MGIIKDFSEHDRDWAIYVPAQYQQDQPAALMIFQDGERMRDVNGRWRIPVVFDNLIARGDMPPTIAVFINPGHDQVKTAPSATSPPTAALNTTVWAIATSVSCSKKSSRRLSSDTTFRTDPEMRAIGGSSSGAICAFTAAWERPDLFRKVYSNVGSFTNLRGGRRLSGTGSQDGTEADSCLHGRHQWRRR